MADDALDDVYSFAERAYIRMQASEVLLRCLEDVSAAPMHRVVESLLLTSQDSLDLLREILAETSARKSQVREDIQQVFNGLKTNLASYGVHLRRIRQPFALITTNSMRFLKLLRTQGVVDDEPQAACMRLFEDARELMASLGLRYSLLDEMEKYLEDWLWGAIYQSLHNPRRDVRPPTQHWIL